MSSNKDPWPEDEPQVHDYELFRLYHLPWSRTVAVDEDGHFIAFIPELDGCFAVAPTAHQAFIKLGPALLDWLESALKEDKKIPEPRRVGKDLSI